MDLDKITHREMETANFRKTNCSKGQDGEGGEGNYELGVHSCTLMHAFVYMFNIDDLGDPAVEHR